MPTNFKKKDVAGAVILYNSENDTVDTIQTYLEQVEKLYVVDNSSLPNHALISALKAYPHVHYHSLVGNKGIAAALNWAAQKAILDEFSLLLTMDDDTRTPPEMVNQMIDFWNSYPSEIGILSGVHHNKKDDKIFRPLMFTLTSGNLLSLTAYQEIGGFNNDLFIDHVDHEFGLRLNASGYQVIELPFIRLDHKLGYSRHIKIGSFVLGKYGTHSPIRLYYFTRNGIYLSYKYCKTNPEFVWTVFKEILKKGFKSIILDNNRLKGIHMLQKGIKDGLTGRLGQFNE